MKTEHELAFALKNMMAEKPLDSISVLSLTKKCHVNRQTFYYYYHDIYDLLSQVFLDEKIDGIERCKNYTSLLTKLFEYYEKNSKFLDATLNSAGKELFQEFVYNIFYTSTLRFITDKDENKELPLTGRKSIARFYASAFSNSMIYYLTNYRNKTLKGLLSNFTFVYDDQLSKSIQNYVKNNAK